MVKRPHILVVDDEADVREVIQLNLGKEGFEVVMAVYESARLSARVVPPVKQERFPLDLMIADGRL